MVFRLGSESVDKSMSLPSDNRSRVLHWNAQVLIQKRVLNIENRKDDYCFLWCILRHIHRVDMHAARSSKYAPFTHELCTTGLQFPLKFWNMPKFEKLYSSISVNVLIFENNVVFQLYASKHRDRNHHVKLLMISNNEGKFHYLLVRDLSVLVHGWTKYDGNTHVCPYCLDCFSERGCLPLTCVIFPCIPSRIWSIPHPTSRRRM